MKLLVITYSYAPDLTPRAFRWAAVAAELVRAGHEVDVLCAAPADGEEAALPGLAVHRVRDRLLNASARVSPGSGAGALAQGGLAALRAAPRGAARALWRAAYWPDYACGWIVPAARAAGRLCASRRYDRIVSVSHPFTGHLVGLLATRHAPGVPWLVDIGDPFHLMNEPAPNNRRLYAALNRAVERRVLARADAATFTTPEAKRLYQAHFGLAGGKAAVIPPLLSLPAPAAAPAPRTDGALRLVYVGTLYRKLRSPERLVALVRALGAAAPGRQVELHFYGSLNDCADLVATRPGEGARIQVHGLVGRSEIARAMADADVLVNIGNASASQLASKVVEYMAMGKPILNLAGPDRDASVAELAGYPSALTIGSSDEVTAPATVRRVAEFVMDPPAAGAAVAAAVRSRYSAASIARRYAELLAGMRAS
jgi:glycosyltransferase involved in cell wall biosynthesis